MLAGSSIAIVPTHYEEYLPEKQVYDQQQAHNFLKQVIISITHKETSSFDSLLHII
jgi:hypothetical protein